ncbi:MAG: penicillin-binding transpeptidase domain-containing protein [Anaerolineaceae bacterium]|nr:penicillin-binding transpeptidase domain-containing protein [Anaerolineaceae bacterium]MCY4107017.1 penicillin-binding transpeptidase domain-containing protein [Chloroflexota bacterium]
MIANETSLFGWRLSLFRFVVLAVFIVFVLRLYQLQIIEHDQYIIDADENRLSELPQQAIRGIMVDRNNRELAVNVPSYNVTIIPAALPLDPAAELAIFNRISALTNAPAHPDAAELVGQVSIAERVDEGERIAPFRPVTVAADVEFTIALQILEERIDLPGVDIEPTSVREYPYGSLTSHVVGYLGPIPAEEDLRLRELGYNPAYDRIGYAGMEASLESRIAGQRGSILREVDVAGEVLQVLRLDPPIPGLSYRLTLDVDLQAVAEESLVRWIDFRNENPIDPAKGVSQQGIVIAMNPQTGEILTMVSYPSYDNARFARSIDAEYYFDLLDDPLKPLVNQATQGLYPPGSVWKVITGIGVLEEKVIDPQTLLFDEGELTVENRYAPNDPAASQTFVCWLDQGHGRVNFLQGLAWSCDVYFYQIGGGNVNVSSSFLRPGGLGIEDLFRYATAFGINTFTGIELPFEYIGRMPDPDWKRILHGESWSTGDTYNASFGQGYINVTSLQLINSVAAIANGGTLYQPTLIREVIDPQGNIVEPFTPQVLRHVRMEHLPEDAPVTLLLIEDMIMQGAESLACRCDPTSESYNPDRCDPANYSNAFNLGAAPEVFEARTYRIFEPPLFSYLGTCEPLRFDPDYQPAFATLESIDLIQRGMRDAVTVEGGTALAADLTYVEVAGKTGTAEYCDNVAQARGFCRFGAWAAHAWFAAYAPYEDPEILVLAFIYNGEEGSRVALPVVMDTIEAYFRFKENRPPAEVQSQSIE